MMPLTGHCNCNRVTVTIKDPKPVMDKGLDICHCTDCRRFTGANGAWMLTAAKDNVEVKGETKPFDVQGESGDTVTRFFCPSCGSYAARKGEADASSIHDGSGEELYIHAGLFDTGTWPEPTVEIWMRSAEKWEVPFKGAKVKDKQ